jgi:hypothetical protein
MRPVCLAVFCLSALSAPAQYGTAPNNYYPEQYSGSTFTGVVTDTDGDILTLTYVKRNKSDVFVGRLETPCSVPRGDRSSRGMAASDVPKGTSMTAYFVTEEKKNAGQKSKQNVILAISFETWNGHKVSTDDRRIYFCTAQKHLQFKAF